MLDQRVSYDDLLIVSKAFKDIIETRESLWIKNYGIQTLFPYHIFDTEKMRIMNECVFIGCILPLDQEDPTTHLHITFRHLDKMSRKLVTIQAKRCGLSCCTINRVNHDFVFDPTKSNTVNMKNQYYSDNVFADVVVSKKYSSWKMDYHQPKYIPCNCLDCCDCYAIIS